MIDDSDDPLEGWLRTGDLDELLREVDRCCDRRDWVRLLRVRDRCRDTSRTGHQLWPVASWAEYRSALEAPADVAAAVVEEGGGHLSIGPLTEVVAQHHRWVELDALLTHQPTRGVVAHERAVRGDPDLGSDPALRASADDGGVPLVLAAWERPYALADYRSDSARFPAPALTALDRPLGGVPGRPEADGDDGTEALLAPVRHWSAGSSGQVRACCVDGSAADAVATLLESTAAPEEAGACVPGTQLSGAAIELGEALTLLAWAAASGAAHGRRRGAAAGRFDAWWAAAVLAGVDDDWPLDIGPAAAHLRWWRWGPVTGDVGWWCRLAVEDPEDGLAWALEATDRNRRSGPGDLSGSGAPR